MRSHPAQPDALCLLGCVAYQTGDSFRPSGAIQQSPHDRPQPSPSIITLSIRLDKFDETEASLLRAIALADLPEFKNSLGVLRTKQGRLTEALAAYYQALAQDPGFADAHYNLGNAHRAG
ncbi:MAG TPA: tetratricopeptide repeat protein [Myxococcota bacterium]|nr:tetratricopeptide repeat protein [Myxococcota bacterium]